MSDSALDKAQQRRTEATARLADAKAAVAGAQAAVAAAREDLDKIDNFIALWHEFAGDEVGDAQLPSAGGVLLPPQDEHLKAVEPRRGKRPRGNPKKEIVAQISREIIEANGGPMLRAPLFAAVRERGFDIKGADPEMVFSTMLWRMPKAIIRLPDVGYWLVEKPYEPIGYVPGVQRTMIDKEGYDMQVADGTVQVPDNDEGTDDDDASSESKTATDLPEHREGYSPRTVSRTIFE